MHHNLFEKLINFVLADSTDDIRARRCVDLISLPLNEEEENWFDEYLKDGKGRTLLGARDTLIARGLLKGNPKDLLAYEKNMVNRKVNGVNWMTFKESVQHGLGKIDH